MRRKKEEFSIIGAIITMIILSVVAFNNGGFTALFKLWNDFCTIFLAVFVWMNMITISLTGDSIITILLSSSIIFIIVGFVFSYIDAPKGKIGHLFGKTLFWLIGIPVTFILNFIGKIIFNTF